MTSYPDPLFREGLEHYRKPAPASAWERIESGLDKKKHKSPWLRIAAGVVILICASILLWHSTQTITSETEVAVSSQQSSVGNGQSAVGSQQSSVSSMQYAVGNKQSLKTDSIVDQEDSPVEERTSAERSRSSRKEHGRSSRQPSVVSRQLAVSSQQSPVSSQQSIENSHEVSLVDTNEKNSEPSQEPYVEKSTDMTSIDASPDSRGTTISYSADMVNERFIKKDAVAEATPEKKNASGLQKVIEKALELKNEESVLGDLRDMKNEWLTINYPAKRRETNK